MAAGAGAPVDDAPGVRCMAQREDDDESWLRERFCELPFHYAEVQGGGETYLCCPRHAGYRSIGSYRTAAADAVWGSDAAQAIRRGVLDGTFSHCDKNACPRILSRSLARREDMLNHPYFGAVIRTNGAALAAGPDMVKLCHDSSCNLSCPSCRTRMIVADGAAQAELDRVLGGFILPLASGVKLLILSGDGDPFASKHYRDILRTTARTHPGLRIALHTNAVLCDGKAWEECSLEGRVAWIDVSVDAARPETYAVVRRGGDFPRLLANLEFLGGKRRRGEIEGLQLSFVVQAANYREMPDFVALGKRIGANRVRFMLVHKWGRGMDDAEYHRAKVWDEIHPDHAAFRAVLRDPALRDPVVILGDVFPLHAAANAAANAAAAAAPEPALRPLARVRRWLRRRAA